MVKFFNNRIMTRGGESSHIKCCTHGRASSPDNTLTSHTAAIPIQGCYSHQTSYLPSIQSTQFRKTSYKSNRSHRSYTLNTPQKVIFFLPNRTQLNKSFKIMVDIIKFILKPFNMSGDAFLHDHRSSGQAVPFSSYHFNYLSPAGQQARQFLGFRVGHSALFRVDSSSKMSYRFSIQDICLGQLSCSFSEISHLARINHCCRNFSCSQFSYRPKFKASCSLQYYERWRQLFYGQNRLVNALMVILKAPHLFHAMSCHIQLILGYINSYINTTFDLLLLVIYYGPALRNTGSYGPRNCSGSFIFSAVTHAH